MPTINSSFSRDNNRIPITTDGIITTDAQTIVGNNASGIAVPIFTITGSIEVRGLWGVVTTALGVAHTAAYWRLNDGTNTPAITLSTGTDLSAAVAGSIFYKKALAATALTLLNSSQARVSEPATLETNYYSPFLAIAKAGTTTNIEYLYSTTDTPTTGAITFYLRWLPTSRDAQVTAL